MQFYEGFDTGEEHTGRTTRMIVNVANWLIKDGPQSVVVYAATIEGMQRLACLLCDKLKMYGAEMQQDGHVYSYIIYRTRPDPSGEITHARVRFTSDLYRRRDVGTYDANEVHIADHYAIEEELRRIKEKISLLRRLHKGDTFSTR